MHKRILLFAIAFTLCCICNITEAYCSTNDNNPSSNISVRFVKVNDVSTLQESDELLIVNEEHKMALGAKDKTNFGAVSATFLDDGSVVADGATTVTLEGSASSGRLKTQYGYLSVRTAKSYDELTTSTTKNPVNSTTNVSLKMKKNNSVSILFIGTNKYLRYNSNQEYFKCYYMGQDGYNDIHLYKKVEGIAITVGSTGYATTYYSNRSLKLPAGITAYTYTMMDGVLAISHRYSTGNVVPAGTGIVIKAEEPGTYTLTTSNSDDAPSADPDNMLRGSDDVSITEGGAKYYKLTTKNGKNVGFYWGAKDGAAFSNGAHKAYLAIPAGESSNAKSGYSFGDITNAISSIDVNVSPDITAPMYNLSGQRVTSSYHGIVIQDGRKFIRK